MKVAYKCPYCNHKESISMSYILMIVCFLSLIGIIPWAIWYYKRTKCPKCKTQMQWIMNVNSK